MVALEASLAAAREEARQARLQADALSQQLAAEQDAVKVTGCACRGRTLPLVCMRALQ